MNLMIHNSQLSSPLPSANLSGLNGNCEKPRSKVAHIRPDIVRQFSFLNLGLLVALAALVVFLLINQPGFAADEVPGQQLEEPPVEAEQSVPGLGQIVPLEIKLAKSLQELEKELRRVEQERDILKKALAIFSQKT